MVISSTQFGRTLRDYINNTIRGFEKPALIGKKYADERVYPRGRNDGSYNDVLSPPWVYVRMWGDDADVREAMAVNINPKANLSVVVRENWEGDLTIIRLNDRQAYAGFGDAAGAYSSGATYLEATGAIVGARNLRMGRLRLAEASSLKITADAFVYYDRDGLPQQFAPSGSLDLTSHVPGSTGEKRYVLISFNRDSSSPELVATAGDIKTVLSYPSDAAEIAVPENHLPLGIVELRTGDTTLTESRFLEWRVFLQLPIPDTAGAGSELVTATAGEALTDRDACYIADDGKVYLIDPGANPAIGVVRGFVTAAAALDESVDLAIGGVLDGFAGLTAGVPVYADTAGAITQTKPTAVLDGDQVAIVRLGVARSADSIAIEQNPVQYTKRAALANDETLEIVHYSDPSIRSRKLLAHALIEEPAPNVVSYGSENIDSNLGFKYKSVDTYSSDKCTGGTASASDAGSGFGPGNAFDDNNTTKWAALISSDQWLKYDLGSGNDIVARQYTLTSAHDAATQEPKDWTFEASNNNSDWYVLDTVTGETGWSLSEKRTYTFFNDQSYRYYRWVFTDNNGAAVVTIAEAEVMDATAYAVNNEKYAQVFNVSSAGDVSGVEMFFRKFGSPAGTMTLRIETIDGSNHPTGTLVDANATATYDESNLTQDLGDSPQKVLFDFGTSFELSAGDYALVLSSDRTASETDYVWLCVDFTSSSYSGGDLYEYENSIWAATNSGGVDAAFEVLAPPIEFDSGVLVGNWISTKTDVVNRYGDTSGENQDTKTTFKCTLGDGFDDITCIVELP